MSTEKSLALVLRVVDFSETSVVTTLFTEDFGKIGALAKGARRPKGPFESALDLLAVCRIVFIHKTSDALDLLTEAKLERRFRSAARDLSRLYAGYYVAELLHDLTDTSDPHPVLFHCAESVAVRPGPRRERGAGGPPFRGDHAPRARVAAVARDVRRLRDGGGCLGADRLRAVGGRSVVFGVSRGAEAGG